MFDQSKAISVWRAQLAQTGTMFEADLDELESHLHDELDGLAEVGFEGEEAFRIATERLGETHSLADEFAKVNPLLAWRAALFWVTVGIMLVLTLLPVMTISSHAAVAASLSLHLGTGVASLLVWAIVVGSPLGFFGLLFPFVRRRLESRRPWRASPAVRMGVIVGSAFLALATHLGFEWGWVPWLERRAWGPEMKVVWDSTEHASTVLGVSGAVVLAALVLRHRAEAMKNRTSGAPLFWLAIGLFIGCVRAELHYFVRALAAIAGGLAHFEAGQMHRLMWIVTLGSPLALFAMTFAYLKHGAPSPSRLLKARGLLVAVAVSGAMALIALFAGDSVAHVSNTILSDEVAGAGWEGTLLAGIVTSCALPVLVGSIMWRLRQAGTLAISTAP